MSTQEHADATTSAPLPELTDERIDAIESAVFADISRDRTAQRARRGRWWIGSVAAAAVIVVAAVIAPSVGNLVAGSPVSVDEPGSAADAPEVAPDAGGSAPLPGAGDSSMSSGDKGTDGLADQSTSGRDIITTASATVIVDDIPKAVATIGDAAEQRDGYVESMSIGQAGDVIPIDPNTGMEYDTSMPYPYTPDGGWITVRVPAGELTGMVRELSALGEVTASSVNRQDVTEQTVDLRARVEASQASVDRLTELMAQATSVTDLIAAETALAERQATLESYQAQLESLEGMVELSSLTVTLQPVTETVKADPAGFSDGLVAGWNGLVATLNGIVVALGFLIPWLLVIGIAAMIVWGIVRLVRRRKSATPKTSAPAVDADSVEETYPTAD